MGGPWQVRHVPVAGCDPEIVANTALAALQRVDRQMSTYRSDSDLMHVNAGPLRQWLPVPDDVQTVMACANDIARLSDGALNIALGHLVNAWGFGPDDTPDHPPDVSTQRATAALAAIGSFSLRADPPSVWKDEKVAFDLSAIAKGFAVDRAAAALRALGVQNFLVEAAGEIFATGVRPDGQPWQVGLELPVPNEHLVFDHIALKDMALATSGDYRNLRTINGETYSHTLSPLTGFPIKGDLRSVTVLHHSCMRADALATALYVLGPKAGPQFAEAQNISALFLIKETEGFKEVRSEELVRQLSQGRFSY